MKPLGQKPTRFPNKTDCHPPKGFVNWWEAEICTENKGSERQQSKRDIINELKENRNEQQIT